MNLPDEILRAKVVYLASPYSKYPAGLHSAFADVCELAARLLVAGVKVYSPIAHTHPLGLYGGLDQLDLSIWLPFDEAMMAVSSALIVARMDGWDESVGVKHEIQFFRDAQKPIFDLDPDTLALTRRR